MSLPATSGCSPNSRGRRSDTFLAIKIPTKTLNTTSLKCSLPSTDAINRVEKITHVYEGSRWSHTGTRYWNPPGFCKQRKVRYLSNRAETWMWANTSVLSLPFSLVTFLLFVFRRELGGDDSHSAEVQLSRYRCIVPEHDGVWANSVLCVVV